MTPVLKVDPRAPDPESITQAASVIARGGCVVFPTRCLYGLAVDAFHPQAVKRVYAIKQRSTTKPLLILVSETGKIHHVADSVSKHAKKMMARFWPGSLTVIVPANSQLPPALTAETGTIGVRQAGHPVAAALAQACRNPITGTSANLSGRPGCRTIEELDPSITHSVDLILDCGPLVGGRGSTVIDTTQHPIAILREGSISGKDLKQALCP